MPNNQLDRKYINEVGIFMDNIYDLLRKYIKVDLSKEESVEQLYYMVARMETYLENTIGDIDKSNTIRCNARKCQRRRDRRLEQNEDEEVDMLIAVAEYEIEDCKSYDE